MINSWFNTRVQEANDDEARICNASTNENKKTTSLALPALFGKGGGEACVCEGTETVLRGWVGWWVCDGIVRSKENWLMQRSA